MAGSQQNAEPVFRGRKLVLNYTDGSPCDSKSKRALLPHEPQDLQSNKIKDHDDDDDDDDDKHRGSSGSTRRKSTIISLLCDKDPLAPKAAVAFVAASPDECTYFFEARSPSACAGVEQAQQQIGPSGVFGVM